AQAGARDIVVHDVPLLVEKGMGPAYHLVVIVHAPEEQRLRRLVDDRGMTHPDATARIRSQADEAARRAPADVWLENTGSASALRKSVEELWTERLVPYERRLHNASGDAQRQASE
ncbi:MAG: dephospho-CoA kinase, partial [Ornithinimicrobium sp.]